MPSQPFISDSLCKQSSLTRGQCTASCDATALEISSQDAGADVLFVGKAADVGVTVSPIRINSLKEFGSLETVGERLLGTERAKASPCHARDTLLHLRHDAALVLVPCAKLTEGAQAHHGCPALSGVSKCEGEH